MWNKIKDGELKGLSIEGYFINKMEKMGKQQFSNEEIREAIKELLSVQKVELNAVTDTIKKAAKVVSLIMSKEMDILSLADDAVQKAGELNQYITKFKEYEQAAKELGVDKVAKEASEAITHYTNKIKRADKMLSSIKSAIKR
jgi:hypothetical protein